MIKVVECLCRNEREYARMIARNSKRRWGGKCRDYMGEALKVAREMFAKEARLSAKIKAREAELARLKMKIRKELSDD